ncbi:MAG: DUF1643 domain-containing protein [Clostridia bacterium]|nr:DUF1643 domain-containing protein [Clostridia bacterium]
MNNTIEFTSDIKTTAVFSKDHKKRYLLKMEWDAKKAKACIIMTYPSTANEYELDQTSMLVRNNAVAQGYGSISIVNVFCGLDLTKPETDRTNSSVIAEECAKADVIIVAYGRGTAHTEGKEQLKEALKKQFKGKLYTIIDSAGAPFSHPLSPRARVWAVEKLENID